MINHQSAAVSSTPSTKQHERFCQFCTNTPAFTWPANEYGNGVRDHSNNTARHPPKRVFSGNKYTKRVRCNTGRMHATHWFLSSILSTYTTTFAWRSLTSGGMIIFPVFSFVANVWYEPRSMPFNRSWTKNIVCNRASLCVILLVRTFFEGQCLHESMTHGDLSKLL